MAKPVVQSNALRAHSAMSTIKAINTDVVNAALVAKMTTATRKQAQLASVITERDVSSGILVAGGRTGLCRNSILI
jgi:hypothetical protein